MPQRSVRLFVRLAWCGVALFTLLFGVATAQSLLVPRASSGPVIPKATKGEQCVADTDVMRKDHMSLLNHQRDETVIEGIRSEPFSLVGCVNCHAQKDAGGEAIRIDAQGQFCESCHTYAAVKIDCFSCHAAKPEEVAATTGFFDPAYSPFLKEHSLLSMSHLSMSPFTMAPLSMAPLSMSAMENVDE